MTTKASLAPFAPFLTIASLVVGHATAAPIAHDSGRVRAPSSATEAKSAGDPRGAAASGPALTSCGANCGDKTKRP
jgi:hypothetical protein